jgi:hypothetical protein
MNLNLAKKQAHIREYSVEIPQLKIALSRDNG